MHIIKRNRIHIYVVLCIYWKLCLYLHVPVYHLYKRKWCVMLCTYHLFRASRSQLNLWQSTNRGNITFSDKQGMPVSVFFFSSSTGHHQVYLSYCWGCSADLTYRFKDIQFPPPPPPTPIFYPDWYLFIYLHWWLSSMYCSCSHSEFFFFFFALTTFRQCLIQITGIARLDTFSINMIKEF